MLNFDFIEKELGIVFPPYFVYYFSRKMFLMLYLITDPVLLSDSLYFLRYWAIEILGNMCISIVYYPGCGITNFEINLIFLIQPFLYTTK